MKNLTLAIMGSTGHIGHSLAEDLLKKGHTVRALGRDEHKLNELKRQGAQIISGDITDPHFLSEVFRDCDALFSFLPPGYHESDMEVFRDRTGDAIAQAIIETGISHVVNLSSIGAHLASETGPVKALHRQEERLNAIEKLNVLHFRPGFFMENLFSVIPTIKSSGMIVGCFESDLAIPMVATKDIAHKIAEFLTALNFSKSTVFEFVGPEEITMIEVAQVIGKAIGNLHLNYKQFSYEEAQKNMIASGMKHQLAHMMVEMYRAFNEGKVQPTQKLTTAHKGKTTFEQFSTVFVEMYKSMRKAA